MNNKLEKRGKDYNLRNTKKRLIKTIHEITLTRRERHLAADAPLKKENKTYKRRALSFRAPRLPIGQKINKTKTTLSFMKIRPLIGRETTRIVNNGSCCVSVSKLLLRKADIHPHFKSEQDHVGANQDIVKQILVTRFADHGKVRLIYIKEYTEHKTIFRVPSTDLWSNTHQKCTSINKNPSNPHSKHRLEVSNVISHLLTELSEISAKLTGSRHMGRIVKDFQDKMDEDRRQNNRGDKPVKEKDTNEEDSLPPADQLPTPTAENTKKRKAEGAPKSTVGDDGKKRKIEAKSTEEAKTTSNKSKKLKKKKKDERSEVRRSPRKSPNPNTIPLLEHNSSTDSDETVNRPTGRKTKRTSAKNDLKGKAKKRYDKDDKSDRHRIRPVLDNDPEADSKYPDEIDIRRHQTKQKNLIKSGSGVHDRRAQQNHRNANFERVDLPKEGEPGHLPGFTRGTRRKKNIKWIEKDRPGNGATLKNFKLGQLLKIKKSMERANASRNLRHYFRAPFLQPKLASADKAMQQVTLDGKGNPLKERKRIRANKDKGREAYTRVDSRRRDSYKFIRKLTKLMNAMDEYIYPDMGPKPKKKLRDIEYISLTDDDETENVQKNREKYGPNCGWIGKHREQPEEDPKWKLAASHLHFLLNPSTWGDRAGDEENHDRTGNFIIVKE